MDVDKIDHDHVRHLLEEGLVGALHKDMPDASLEEIEKVAAELMDMATERGRLLRELRD